MKFLYSRMCLDNVKHLGTLASLDKWKTETGIGKISNDAQTFFFLNMENKKLCVYEIWHHKDGFVPWLLLIIG